jgi:hypothetical protein
MQIERQFLRKNMDLPLHVKSLYKDSNWLHTTGETFKLELCLLLSPTQEWEFSRQVRQKDNFEASYVSLKTPSCKGLFWYLFSWNLLDLHQNLFNMEFS